MMSKADLDREHGALLLAEKRASIAHRQAEAKLSLYAKRLADAYQNPGHLKVEQARIVVFGEPLATDAEMIEVLQDVKRLGDELADIRQRLSQFA